jgi:cob(I)alamin adenosyltransferase
MKIYTKTGDDGTTSLFSGGRVMKDDVRVEAYGTVDELNSVIGFIRTYDLPAPMGDWLITIQNTLFVVGSDLATPLDNTPAWLVRLDDTHTQQLELWIDDMDAQLPRLQAFILPAGHPAAAQTHIARTIARRAERLCVSAHQTTPINPQVIVYLNRLSDFFFTLARQINHHFGIADTEWHGH